MCGRFALAAPTEAITKHFQLKNTPVLTPRYNIAPSHVIPVIRKPGELEFLMWGLRPKWLKEDQQGFINARLETLSEKPAFRNAFKKQRCLIITNGYYEWKQIGNIKQPFLICLPQQQLFAFAGLYDGDTCCLITQAAEHELLKKIHARMPVILTPQQYALWLDATLATEVVMTGIAQNNFAALQIFPVSTKVNNPKHDVIECITPLH